MHQIAELLILHQILALQNHHQNHSAVHDQMNALLRLLIHWHFLLILISHCVQNEHHHLRIPVPLHLNEHFEQVNFEQTFLNIEKQQNKIIHDITYIIYTYCKNKI